MHFSTDFLKKKFYGYRETVWSFLVRGLFVLLLLPFLISGLLRTLPDPTYALVGEEGLSVSQARTIQKALHLDLSWRQQSQRLFEHILEGSWGHVTIDGQPVRRLFFEALRPTLFLIFSSLLLGTLLGILLGGIMISFYLTPLYRLMSLLCITLSALPAAGLGFIFLSITSINLDGIMGTELLEILTLALPWGGLCGQICFRYLLSFFQMPLVLGLRARGLPKKTLLWGHAKTFLTEPFKQLSLLYTIHLLGNTLVVEHLFATYGLGSFLFDSLQRQDYDALSGGLFGLSLFCWLISELNRSPKRRSGAPFIL